MLPLQPSNKRKRLQADVSFLEEAKTGSVPQQILLWSASKTQTNKRMIETSEPTM